MEIQHSGFTRAECEWYKNIDPQNLPLIYTPKSLLRYSNTLCVCASQSAVIDRLYRQRGIEATMRFYMRAAARAKTAVPAAKAYEITKNLYALIDRERVMCDDYYVCYTATARPFSLLYRILSLVRQIQLGKDVNTQVTLFRASNPQNIHNTKEMFALIKNKIGEQKTADQPNPAHANGEDALGNKYDMDGQFALDWHSWFKDVCMSVNLSLLGSHRTGESTLFYFLTGKANTSVDIAMKLIRNLLDELPIIDAKRDIFYAQLVSHYEYYYQRANSTRYHVGSSLFQIFIKKSVVDSLLYISTPFGNPLPIKASEFLEDLQTNNADTLVGKMSDIYYNIPDSAFTVLPNLTRTRMKADFLHSSLLSVQGRLISTADDILLEEGNVRVFDFSETFQDEM